MTDGVLGQAAVFLAAALVCVPLAKRLGMGSVLGYLLAGIVIGPFCLGFVGKEGRHHALRRIRRGDDAVPDRSGTGTVHFWRMRKTIVGWAQCSWRNHTDLGDAADGAWFQLAGGVASGLALPCLLRPLCCNR